MKIRMQKTKAFYVFASPVTVNRSENILLQGVEDKTLTISSPLGRTSRIQASDGNVILKPYEMVNGLHQISSVDERGKETALGTLLIVENKATVAMLDYGSAIKALALVLDKSVGKIEANEKNIKNLLDDNKIDLG